MSLGGYFIYKAQSVDNISLSLKVTFVDIYMNQSIHNGLSLEGGFRVTSFFFFPLRILKFSAMNNYDLGKVNRILESVCSSLKQE
jgi:hypothetical protein